MHLFMADIANPDLFVCGCRTLICLDIALKMVNRPPPHCWGREVATQFAKQFVTAVTAPSYVGCVVWSLHFPFVYGLMSHRLEEKMYSIILTVFDVIRSLHIYLVLSGLVV